MSNYHFVELLFKGQCRVFLRPFLSAYCAREKEVVPAALVMSAIHESPARISLQTVVCACASCTAGPIVEESPLWTHSV